MTTRLRASFALENAAGGRAGEDRLRILDAIAQAGSITGAGALLGLSYRAAWDGVQRMNAIFGHQLIVTANGGVGGGGRAALTPAGERVREELRRIGRDIQARIDRLHADLDLPEAGLRTSAANTWRGTALTSAPGEILVQTHAGAYVVASCLRTAGGYPQGAPVTVSIPPDAVLIAAKPLHDTSARNSWPGRVASRRDQATCVILNLDLNGGESLSARLTHESADRLKLVQGARANAIVKASQVEIATI